MAKKISSQDLFEGKLAAEQIGEMLQLRDITKDVVENFKQMGREYKSAVSRGNAKTSADINQVAKDYNLSETAVREYEKSLQQLNTIEAKIQLTMAGLTSEVAAKRKELAQLTQAVKVNAEVTNEQIGAYQKASNELAKMNRAYKDLVISGKSNTEEAKKFKVQLDELSKSVRAADESVGQYHRNVGNYESGNRKLNTTMFQMTQILREIPNFAISARIGIMSLSNNLPMLIDEFRMLNAINKEMKANGEKTVSVWKLMGQSIFSLQGLVILGVTALTAFGDKIIGYITGTFEADKVTKALSSSLASNKYAIELAGNEYVEARREINTFSQYVDLSKKGLMSKENVLNSYNNTLGKTMGKVESLTDLEKKLIDQGPQYIRMMALKAASSELFSGDNAKQMIENETRLLDEQDKFVKKYGDRKYVDMWMKSFEEDPNQAARIAKTNMNQLGGIADAFTESRNFRIKISQLSKRYLTEAARIATNNDGFNVFGGGEGKTGGGSASSNAKDNILNNKDKTAEDRKKLGQDLARAEYESLPDGYVKEATKIMAEYKSTIEKIDLEFAELTGAEDVVKKNRLKQLAANKRDNDLDSAQQKANSRQQKIYDDELERRRQNDEKVYKLSMESYQKEADVAILKAETEANELMKKAANAEEQKKIQKDLSDTILRIKITQAEKELGLTKIYKESSLAKNIEDLILLQEKLNKLKSDLGITDLKDKEQELTKGDKTRNNIKIALTEIDKLETQMEQRKLRSIDRQLEQTRKRIDQQRALANLGIANSKENLAYEERKEAELEKKREQIERRQQRRQMAIAAMNAASQKYGKGDGNAAANTIKDITLIMGAIAALPVFYEGTEDTGPGGVVDNKGGFHAILHPHERVMTAEQNKIIGDISNEELARLAMMYQSGMMYIPVESVRKESVWIEVKNELREVKQAIQDRPVSTHYWSDTEKAIIEVIKAGEKTTKRINKTGGVWRS